jgi:hypothetical protein
MARIALALAALLAVPAARAESPADSGADGYAVESAAPQKPLRVGEKGKLQLAIRPKAPWHVDPRAPMSIKVEAPAGLTVEKAQLSRKDALDAKAEVPRFEVPFTAAAAGQQEARAHLKFYLCKDTICAQQQKTVALQVTVK